MCFYCFGDTSLYGLAVDIMEMYLSEFINPPLYACIHLIKKYVCIAATGSGFFNMLKLDLEFFENAWWKVTLLKCRFVESIKSGSCFSLMTYYDQHARKWQFLQLLFYYTYVCLFVYCITIVFSVMTGSKTTYCAFLKC